MAGLIAKMAQEAEKLIKEKGLQTPGSPKSPKECLKMIMHDPALKDLKDELIHRISKMKMQELRLAEKFMEGVREYDEKVQRARDEVSDEYDPNSLFAQLGIEFEDLDPDDIGTIREMLRQAVLYKQQQEAATAKVFEDQGPSSLALAKILAKPSPSDKITSLPKFEVPKIVAHTLMKSQLEFSTAINNVKSMIEDMGNKGLFPQNTSVKHNNDNKKFAVTIEERDPSGKISQTKIEHSVASEKVPGEKTPVVQATVKVSSDSPTPSDGALKVFASVYGAEKTFAPLKFDPCEPTLEKSLSSAFKAVAPPPAGDEETRARPKESR